MRVLLLICLAGLYQHANADIQAFNSGARQVSLIELYTSEGCSSCPRADRWISQFVKADDLWHRFVPLSFHVDYWNYLGWKDRFARSEYSARQRKHKRSGNIAAVYTPGTLVDGQEWRGLFEGDPIPPLAENRPGNLSLRLDGDGSVRLSFTGEGALTGHIVQVGTGLSTSVRRGENAGRELKHDFVVLSHQQQRGKGEWFFKLEPNADATAVAAWVSKGANGKPVQAVGGWLKAKDDPVQTRIRVQQQVADRHEFDHRRDAARKPFELFQFLGLKEGMVALDVGAYAGYTTEMMSAAVGSTGRVYSHNTEKVLNTYADGYYLRTMTERLANNRLPNVTLHLREYDDLGLEEQVDVAFLGNLLHDFYYRDGEANALAFLASINRALKPGGVLGVMDHVGLEGENNARLHRMPVQVARDLLEQSGFVIEVSSKLFANPDDDHRVMVYADEVYLQTDRFLFRARKPGN